MIDSIKNKDNVSEGNSNGSDMGNTVGIACGAVAFLAITAALLLMKVRGKRENNDDTSMINNQAPTIICVRRKPSVLDKTDSCDQRGSRYDSHW